MSFLDDAEKVEDEIEQRRSVERFLMENIYPKLSREKKETIDLHISRGVSIHGAFEFAGINYSVCKR